MSNEAQQDLFLVDHIYLPLYKQGLQSYGHVMSEQ